MSEQENILKLKSMIEASDNIVFFGGAGVSTESGFPDFRTETGIYNTVHKYGCSPEQILSHTFFMRKPEIFLFWKRRVKMILIRIREKSCLEILLYRSIKC